MYCQICGAMAWCVNEDGVQEHLFCYDCSGLVEIQEDERCDAAYDAFLADCWGPEDGGCCPCGGTACDGTCDSNQSYPAYHPSEDDLRSADDCACLGDVPF